MISLSKNLKRTATVCAAALMIFSAGVSSMNINANASRRHTRYSRVTRRHHMKRNHKHAKANKVNAHTTYAQKRAKLEKEIGVKEPKNITLKQLKLIAKLETPKTLSPSTKKANKNLTKSHGKKAALVKHANKAAKDSVLAGKFTVLKDYMPNLKHSIRKQVMTYLRKHPKATIQKAIFRVWMTQGASPKATTKKAKAVAYKAKVGELNHRIDNSLIFNKLGKLFKNTKHHHAQIYKYMAKHHSSLRTAIKNVALKDLGAQAKNTKSKSAKAKVKGKKAALIKSTAASDASVEQNLTKLALNGSFYGLSKTKLFDTISYLIQHPTILQDAVNGIQTKDKKQPKKNNVQKSSNGSNSNNGSQEQPLIIMRNSTAEAPKPNNSGATEIRAGLQLLDADNLSNSQRSQLQQDMNQLSHELNDQGVLSNAPVTITIK